MSEKKAQARRKLLKRLAAGGGAVIAGKSLPDNWGRPVVDSIMLPAHAQTSLLNSYGSATLVNNNVLQNRQDSSLLARAAEILMPEAKAGGKGPSASMPQVCVTHVREGGEQPDVIDIKAHVLQGLQCLNSVLLSATNVPVNPGVETPLNVQYPCGFGDAGDWLEEMGLINSAHAIEIARCSVHTLTGPEGGAFGYINWGRLLFRFNLPRMECAGFVIECCTPN